jgi:hypothetical protein
MRSSDGVLSESEGRDARTKHIECIFILLKKKRVSLGALDVRFMSSGDQYQMASLNLLENKC